MCGIAGFVETRSRRSATDSAELVAVMGAALKHRGPDDAGVWTDNESGIAFGHSRLSIIDLSPEGHQPMTSGCGRYVISYNGEIYNFPQIRRDLEELGEEFRGHSDTEVLLTAISRWGLLAALERSNGMFAFSLWDRRERVLHLCRDRLGQKPLYYGWAGPTFIFGSELKALVAHPDFEGSVDRGALTLFLRHGQVPSPHSIYQGIRKLPPGTLLSLPLDDLERGEIEAPRPYWSAREAAEAGLADPFTGDAQEAVTLLGDLLGDAVRQCMVSDVPLGAFLSGGIDSSTVVALMQAQATAPVKTFSIGFHDVQYNEAQYAAAVAAHLGTDHTELYVTDQDARDIIPDLPALYDEPFADSSQIPTYLVSKLAREHVKVSLSGDGGDELFGGYNRYAWGRSIARLLAATPAPLRRAMISGTNAIPVEGWNALARSVSWMLPRRLRYPQAGDKLHKLAGILDSSCQEEMYWRLISLWQDPAAAVVGAREPTTPLRDWQSWPRLDDFVHQMMLLDAQTYLPDDILTKVDRASMGVSLESRVPLLDHRVFEFAWRLPLAIKMRHGQGRWPLRQVLYRHVPPTLIERPKMGFGVPIAEWLRGGLRDWAADLLDESRLRQEGFFEPGPIRRKWSEHLSGQRNWQYQLWAVLMFQAWLDAQRRSA